MSAIFTGCSAVRLGYNKLPEIASWWLDGYIDFSDAQGSQAKAALQKLQAWHRKEELPALAELLSKLSPNAIVVIDAVKRDGERQLAELFAKALPRHTLNILNHEKGTAVISPR